MIEYLSFDFNSLLQEVQSRAREEGIGDSAGYNYIIDQVLDEQLEYGEVDDDNALESIRQKLQASWQDFDRSRR